MSLLMRLLSCYTPSGLIRLSSWVFQPVAERPCDSRLDILS